MIISIVDYGMGNIGSIANMIRKAGGQSNIITDSKQLETSYKIILPGVGSFDKGMENIISRGFLPILNRKALDEKVPILGICLGMQLLTKHSEEGNLTGLGWVDAITIRFSKDINMRIPHMGWNTINFKEGNILFQDLPKDARFYFVHSYHVVCNNQADILAETTYGCEFVSAVQHENIFGVQFHPEKSHKYGMHLIKNFVEL